LWVILIHAIKREPLGKTAFESTAVFFSPGSSSLKMTATESTTSIVLHGNLHGNWTSFLSGWFFPIRIWKVNLAGEKNTAVDSNAVFPNGSLLIACMRITHKACWRMPSPTLRVSNSVSRDSKGPNKFPGDAAIAGRTVSLWEPLMWKMKGQCVLMVPPYSLESDSNRTQLSFQVDNSAAFILPVYYVAFEVQNTTGIANVSSPRGPITYK